MPRVEVILAALLLTFANAAAAAPRQPPLPMKPPLSSFQQEQRMSFDARMRRWDTLLAQASLRFNVPEKWLRAVMLAESGGRTMQSETQPIESGMGAMGLMQLMPKTYSEMRREHGFGVNPYDPHDNIFAAAAYLHWLHAKYGYPKMFAAYNDGPGNLEARMRDLGLLPRETQAYVAKITGMAIAGGVFARGKLKFTRPNGVPVVIEGASVRGIRAPFPGEYADGVQTVINAGRLTQGVRESLVAVKTIIRAHGGAA